MILKGKNIVITGSGRGIGQAVAIGLAKEGANVGLISRTLEELTKTKEEIENLGIGVKVVVKTADVLKFDELTEAFKAFNEELGPLNGVIANAGASGRWDSHEFDSEKFALIVNVNITGVFNTFKAAYPHLKKDDKKDKAKFFITGSGVYSTPMAKFAAYTASKFGVVGLQKELALEYKRENITFNMILPTTVDTRLLRGKKAGDGNKPDTTMNPWDLNDYYVFMMSDQANRINDQLISTTDLDAVKSVIAEAPSEKKESWDAFKVYLEEKKPKTCNNVKKLGKLIEFLIVSS